MLSVVGRPRTLMRRRFLSVLLRSVLISTVIAAASPMASPTYAAIAAPTLTVNGTTLSWTKVGSYSTYEVAIKVPGQTAQYKVMKALSWTPPGVPGQTVSYGVHVYQSGAWSREVQITYPTTTTTTVSPTPTPSPVPSPAMRYGIVGDARGWGDSYYDKFKALGVSMAREQWREGDLTSTPLSGAAARGLQILPLLQPNTYSQTPDTPPSKQWLVDWVSRYGPGGTYWSGRSDAAYAPRWIELANEPWASNFSGGSAPSAASYARWIRGVVPAIRAANPNVRILIAGELSTQQTWDAPNDWIPGMYAAVPNLNDYFDGWTSHPYGGPLSRITVNPRWAFGRIETLRSTFVDRGAGAKQVWITEIGNPTGGGTGGYTEDQQAQYLTDYVNRAKQLGYVNAFFVYHYRDVNCSTSTECYFGLTRNDGSQKPAYSAYRQLILAG